ncbi:hypothetical protein B0H19DRAFT_1076564 [Mycena capillaripes]|nr:hypothetical protein B0H19DRAFT_1076564 [Mycena capillaripes]
MAPSHSTTTHERVGNSSGEESSGLKKNEIERRRNKRSKMKRNKKSKAGNPMTRKGAEKCGVIQEQAEENKRNKAGNAMTRKGAEKCKRWEAGKDWGVNQKRERGGKAGPTQNSIKGRPVMRRNHLLFPHLKFPSSSREQPAPKNLLKSSGEERSPSPLVLIDSRELGLIRSLYGSQHNQPPRLDLFESANVYASSAPIGAEQYFPARPAPLEQPAALAAACTCFIFAARTFVEGQGGENTL